MNCVVSGCDRPSQWGECRYHRNRRYMYGVYEWDPIPWYAAPGVGPRRVAELRDLHERGGLAAYCTEVLNRYARPYPDLPRLSALAFWRAVMSHDNCGCVRRNRKVA